MSRPTCCCCSVLLDRCDRCDLLVGLEGFHLMSVSRIPSALVLDVELCNQLVGCPGCGVIDQGHGRVVVEVIDTPWAGVPAWIRWLKRRWICREHTCQIATFTEQNHSVRAPRARLGVWAIRQLRFAGATISGLARQLGTTWNTVWSHIKPRLQATSDDPARIAGARVLGAMSTCGTTRIEADGARVNSLASWTTRGKDHPTAHSLDLVPGRSGTVYKNGGPSAEKTCARGCESRRWIPFQGQQERHRLGLLQGRHQRARCLSHRHTSWRRPR